MKYCKICGAIMNDQDNFCARCGSRQEGVGINSAPGEIENPFEKKQKKTDLQDYRDGTEVTSDDTSANTSGGWKRFKDARQNETRQNEGSEGTYRSFRDGGGFSASRDDGQSDFRRRDGGSSGSWDAGGRSSGSWDADGTPYGGGYTQSSYTTPDDSGSILYLLLGLFIPLVGLILFIIRRGSKPRSAAKALIGAVIGIVIGVILSVFGGILFARLASEGSGSFAEQIEEELEDWENGEETYDEEIPDPEDVAEDFGEYEDGYAGSYEGDIDDPPMIQTEQNADGSYTLWSDDGRTVDVFLPEDMQVSYAMDGMLSIVSDASEDGMSSSAYYYYYDEEATDELIDEFLDDGVYEDEDAEDLILNDREDFDMDGRKVSYRTFSICYDGYYQSVANVVVNADDAAVILYVYYGSAEDPEETAISEEMIRSFTEGIRITG